MQDRSTNALLIAFCGLVSGLMLYTFYASPLRERIESKLFDIRTRLAPNLVDTSAVGIIAIDDETIDAMDGKAPAPAPIKEPKPRNLSYASLLTVVRAAQRTPAAQIAVLIPNQIFSYDDPRARELADLAANDERLVLGVFDLSVKTQSPDLLPDAFKKVQTHLAKADITRYYRREIVRDFVILEDGELPYLPYLLATRSARQQAERAVVAGMRQPDGKIAMKLNYFSPSLLHTVKAEDLVNFAAAGAPGSDLAKLAGRALLIGYTGFRPWTAHDREATFVNSPWQVDGNEVEDGIPVVQVQGIALANIARGLWLRTAPTAAVATQALIITLLTLVIWNFSVGFASFLFIGGWSCVLLLHALLFAFGNQYIPLADSALFSSLAMVGGAMARLRTEGRVRAEHEAVARSDGELAHIQERFLNRFAAELQTINAHARLGLKAASACRDQAGAMRDAYVRALGSCEELDDYLSGIQQFARLGGKQLAKPTPERVEALATIYKVVRQFESRAEEARVQIVVDPARDGVALADPTLLAQILYNLVSNAVKYSPPGGTVHIRVGPAGPHRLALTVKDEGPGIAPEFHDRIFEKFYRVQDDHVYKLKGHGLGLFLSRFFAGQLGATIAVDSAPGRGALFTLTTRSV